MSAVASTHPGAQAGANPCARPGRGPGMGSVCRIRRRFHPDRAIRFAQVAPRTGNGESFVVEQALDLEHHVYIFLAVHAVSAWALNRLKHGEFGFPVAQHERFQLRQAADLADAVEAFFASGLRCGSGARHLLSTRSARSIFSSLSGGGPLHPRPNFPAVNASVPLIGQSSFVVVPVALVAAFARAGTRVAFGLAQALEKADGSTREVPFFANLVFQEALIAEVQRILLIGKNHERWRRSLRLRHVVNLHGPGLWRGPALQINFFLEPAIEFRRGYALFARSRHLIDQREEFARAVSGLSGKKYDGRVAQEFEFVANHPFVIIKQPAFVEFAEGMYALCCTQRSTHGGSIAFSEVGLAVRLPAG